MPRFAVRSQHRRPSLPCHPAGHPLCGRPVRLPTRQPERHRTAKRVGCPLLGTRRARTLSASPATASSPASSSTAKPSMSWWTIPAARTYLAPTCRRTRPTRRAPPGRGTVGRRASGPPDTALVTPPVPGEEELPADGNSVYLSAVSLDDIADLIKARFPEDDLGCRPRGGLLPLYADQGEISLAGFATAGRRPLVRHDADGSEIKAGRKEVNA